MLTDARIAPTLTVTIIDYKLSITKENVTTCNNYLADWAAATIASDVRL